MQKIYEVDLKRDFHNIIYGVERTTIRVAALSEAEAHDKALAQVAADTEGNLTWHGKQPHMHKDEIVSAFVELVVED